MNRKNALSAVAAIDQAGTLLVYPIDNRREPASLWYHLHPRSEMRWEWDESGDDRVANLWHLRGELSTSRRVVYTKWFRGRATFFSKPVFTALLRALNPSGTDVGLSVAARSILTILEGESPLSTKELKRQSGLKGRAFEREYERALRELWSRMLIVAFGEVDDGAFPSLAVGATRVLFEDLWTQASRMSPAEAETTIAKALSPENPFFKFYAKLKREAASAASTAPSAGKAAGLRRQAPSAKNPKSSSGSGSVVTFDDLVSRPRRR